VDELCDIVSRAIEGGVTAVQFREKSATPQFCTKAAARLWEICRRGAVPLIINADVLARCPSLEGDGVHHNARTFVPREAAKGVVGYSAHRLEEAQSAFAAGADFCTISPVYDTPTKQGVLPAVGLQELRRWRAYLSGQTLVALGGIDATNAAAVIHAGADGIAVMRAIMEAEDPMAAAQMLRAAVVA
jgi:thiamine-phosphate pyrophosphorylase